MDERSRTVGFVWSYRSDHSGWDKGSLQKWRIEGIRDKAYHPHIRQVRYGAL